VIFCTRCGTSLREEHQYCWNCGTKAEGPAYITATPARILADAPFRLETPPASPGKLVRVFGLDPRIAFLTLVVDVMLNAADTVTAGMLLPVSVAAGIVLGYITYRAQLHWYGDDQESARIKAIIIALLTAIPTPLPELLYIPAGLVGLWHGFRRKVSQS